MSQNLPDVLWKIVFDYCSENEQLLLARDDTFPFWEWMVSLIEPSLIKKKYLSSEHVAFLVKVNDVDSLFKLTLFPWRDWIQSVEQWHFWLKMEVMKLAAMNGRLRLVKYLVKSGRVFSMDNICYWAMKGQQEEVLRWSLLNCKDEKLFKTVTFWAAKMGDIEIIHFIHHQCWNLTRDTDFCNGLSRLANSIGQFSLLTWLKHQNIICAKNNLSRDASYDDML